MAEKTTAGPTKTKTVAGKIIRILLKTVLIIILVVATIAVLILTPPVQNFIKNKATTWLTNKLQTKVAIGKIYIGFPKKVVLENIYVEDRQKDTLLSGGRLAVNVSMLKLINSKVEVDQLEIEALTAKVKRVLPDTVYNFQFIIDAFATGDTTVANPEDTAGMAISVKNVEFDKIRLVYDDDVTGNDVTVWLEHFDTEIDEFDLDKMRFSVPETNISGIDARIYQSKPLVEPEEVTEDTAVAAEPPPPVDFDFGEFNVNNIKLDYRNDVSALYSKLDLGELTIKSDDVNLEQQSVSLEQLQLNNTTASLRFGKTQQAEIVKEEAEQETEQQAKSGWNIIVKNIQLNSNNLVFADDNKPRLDRGMDYANLDVRNLSLHASNLIFSPDTISASISKGEMQEQSGFTLNTLKTDFLYSSQRAYLHDLLIETPGTTIRRSIDIGYPSLESLQKDIGKLTLDIDVNESRIQVKDVLTFAPELAAQPALNDPSAIIKVDGRITGSVADMNIHNLNLIAFNSTNVDVKGSIAGLPEAKNVSGNLVIQKIQTSRKDIRLLAPKGSLPENITIPETINLTGVLSGNMTDARGRLNLASNLGNVSLDGTIRNASDTNNAAYDATLVASNLNLGTIMQNDTMYGPLTATISAKGKGFKPKTATGNANIIINSAVYNRYNYKDVRLHADLVSQQANFTLNAADPNINVNLNGKADISGKFPAVQLNAVIDSINAQALNFTPELFVFKGKISADFPNTDPANLNGTLLLSKSTLVTKDQRYPFDTLALSAGEGDTGKFLRLRSDVVNFALTGQYNLVQMGSVIQQAIQPYYALDTAVNKDTLEDYDFRFSGEVVEGPLLKIFLPTLERLEPIKMQGHFASNEGFNMAVDAPLVLMGGNRIQKFTLRTATADNELQLRTNLEQFSAGSALNIYHTTLNADIADNKINFIVNLRDQAKKSKYIFGGVFDQPSPAAYTLTMNPDSLLLNYEKWNIANDNLVRLNDGDVNIRNFSISHGTQQLAINSTNEDANSPIDVRLSQFRIGTITAFAKQDSIMIDGVINGQAQLINVATQPTFVSDINIQDLMFRGDTVGNLAIKVNNTQANVYSANIALTGKDNDMLISGNYKVLPENKSEYDMVLDIKRLQVASIEALSMGAIEKGAGHLMGKFDVAGTFERPEIDGNIRFKDVELTPVMLGSHFTVDNENIAVVDNEGIHFSTFTVQDESKNKLVVDGEMLTTNFINYKLALDVTARNFQALNSSKQNNKLFYGKLFFDSDIQVSGTESSPKIDGSLKINEKTDFTIVVPQTNPGVEEREGIVRFIDKDSVSMDTTVLLAQEDSLNQSTLTGMDISVNIETDKNALLTLIVDPINGDFLSMKGTAQLTGGIDPSGKTTLTGSYEIEEGEYKLSLNLLQRKFQIQKGSKITWLGEPTKADVELTAIYVANTAPLTLVENQVENIQNINYYKQKLPFEVKLMLTGELLKPQVAFDIALPEDQNLNIDATVIENVETRLTQLKSQPSELNKQVFALLLLNRFIQENPFASSGDGGFNAGTMARQSVSKLLTEQLNNLAADLITGVDLNFDVASTEDYTTGSMQNRTDLNVSLSKQLLNDRLRVTVGSNFELEGPQRTNQRQNNLAGNVALDYMLSKDGRYMLRAYRKNEYEGELEGYIIETGLNFIISFDYDHFHDLIRGKKRNDKNKKNDKKSDSALNHNGKADNDSSEDED